MQDRVALYSAEFAADPHRVYREMRSEYGGLAPVELIPGVPATLVLDYRLALSILNDPERFPADPREWQKTVPADSPILPLLQWRPNALRTSGVEHSRYRAANTLAISGVDLNALHTEVRRHAVTLVNTFCEGGSADLLAQYARPLVFAAINTQIGCSEEIGARVGAAFAALMENTGSEQSEAMMAAALTELIAAKRAEPADDIASRLVTHTPALTDVEIIHQLVTLYGAGSEPQTNLIINTLLLMMTDDRFAGSLLGGGLSSADAIEEVLRTDPPFANHCVTYPKQPILLNDAWLPAHQPVVISMAACNNDPAVVGGQFVDNRSHLSWGAGPHACPARNSATLVVKEAIDQILDALPEIELAIPPESLRWRPGATHRSLESLPVMFPPSPPLQW